MSKFEEVLESVIAENKEPRMSTFEYDTVVKDLEQEIKSFHKWVKFYKIEAKNKNSQYKHPALQASEVEEQAEALEDALSKIKWVGQKLGY
jgi:hypothetical protein